MVTDVHGIEKREEEEENPRRQWHRMSLKDVEEVLARVGYDITCYDREQMENDSDDDAKNGTSALARYSAAPPSASSSSQSPASLSTASLSTASLSPSSYPQPAALEYSSPGTTSLVTTTKADEVALEVDIKTTSRGGPRVESPRHSPSRVRSCPALKVPSDPPSQCSKGGGGERSTTNGDDRRQICDDEDRKRLKTLKAPNDLIAEGNEGGLGERIWMDLHSKKEAEMQKRRSDREKKKEAEMQKSRSDREKKEEGTWRRFLVLPVGSSSFNRCEESKPEAGKTHSQSASNAGGGSTSSTAASTVSSLKNMMFCAHQDRMEQEDLWRVPAEARKLGGRPHAPSMESSSLSSLTSWTSSRTSSFSQEQRSSQRSGQTAVSTLSTPAAAAHLYSGDIAFDDIASSSAPATFDGISRSALESKLKFMDRKGTGWSFPNNAKRSSDIGSCPLHGMNSWGEMEFCGLMSSVEEDDVSYGRMKEETYLSALEGVTVTFPSVKSADSYGRSRFDGVLKFTEDDKCKGVELAQRQEQQHHPAKAPLPPPRSRHKSEHETETIDVVLRPEDPAYLAEFPNILCRTEMSQLAARALPTSLTFHRWTRLYSLARHGDTFGVFLGLAGSASQSLLVVQTTRGDVFGAYVSSPWLRERDPLYDANKCVHGCGATFYGSAQACLWRLDRPPSGRGDGTLVVYRWTGANMYIQLVDVRNCTIAFGGGGDGGNFGLVLEDDFRRGSTAPCETFDNEPLCDSEHFNIVDVEVWGFDSGFN